MVLIDAYKTFWQYIGSRIEVDTENVLIVADESDLQRKIKNIEDGNKILVAVIPSSDLAATDRDNYSEIDSCFVFFLKKIDFGSLTDTELFNEQLDTQKMMNAARSKMLILANDIDNHPDNLPHLMRHLIEGKMHTDPEFNYLGCTGWSISFSLRTRGIENENY